MRSVNLTWFLALSVSLMTTAIFIGASLFTTSFFTATVESDLQRYLANSAKTINDDHLRYINNDIWFERSPDGSSLSERLRTLDLSALIFNGSQEVIGAYGIFNRNEVALTNALEVSETVTTKESRFIKNLEISGRQYEVYVTPIVDQGAPVGVLAVAKQANLIRELVETNRRLLLFVLPLVIVLTSGATFIIVSLGMRRLGALIRIINSVSLGTSRDLPTRISFFNEVNRVQESFVRMMDRVQQVFFKQQQFISHASHELKTPLARAVSSLDVMLLTKKQSPADLVTVKKELMHLSRLVESLLLLGKVTGSDKLQLSADRVDIKAATDRVLKELTTEIHERNIRLLVNMPTDNYLIMNQYQGFILLRNILENAVKYCPDNGIVSIKSAPNQTGTEIVVENDGVTTTDLNKTDVFAPFTRGHKTARIPGSGVGLAIVHAIAEANNLKVNYEILDNKTRVRISVNTSPLLLF